MDTDKIIEKNVEEIIENLYSQIEYSSGKSKLAKLRSSIGRSDKVEIYPFIFPLIPNELLGKTEIFSDTEKAIIGSLQLYALLQQGREKCVHEKLEKYQNMGTSLTKLRIGEDREAVDRRFNAMILADNEEELLVHLRHILRLYKTKVKNGNMDFAKLAKDLYRFIHWEDGKKQIRLSWSREYYKESIKGEDNNE